MPFPFSYTGNVEVPFDSEEDSLDKLLSNIVSTLKKVRAKNIVANQNRISFSSGIFHLLSGWNILGTVSKGEIVIDRRNDTLMLTYSLQFTVMLVFVTAGVVGFLGPGIWQSSNFTLGAKIMILAFAWSWLFGINYLITILRFPSFIRKMTEIS